jgi:uncharacterized protein with NRDE domain
MKMVIIKLIRKSKSISNNLVDSHNIKDLETYKAQIKSILIDNVKHKIDRKSNDTLSLLSTTEEALDKKSSGQNPAKAKGQCWLGHDQNTAGVCQG